MKVTIHVENGDQEIEVTRTSADLMSGRGSRVQPERLAAVLDLAVADTRRAIDAPVERPARRERAET